MSSDIIRVIAEYNDNGALVWAADYPGAFARGRTLEEGLAKLPADIVSWCRWNGTAAPPVGNSAVIIQQKLSDLRICDADSDIIFDGERESLTIAEYQQLKVLALRSAEDFLVLYNSIPDKDGTVLTPRKTFYGDVPVTARQMYIHTRSVNEYYFAEIGVDADNEPDILSCRMRGFELLEQQPDFLQNAVFDGSYGEEWSLRKLCRRFIWHDRIHARAMYRMAAQLCGSENIADPFGFNVNAIGT